MKTVSIIFNLTAIMTFSNLAAQNPGEILFSKTALTSPGVESPVTEFQAADAIYSVAYLPETLMKIANCKPESKVELEVFLYSIKPPLYSYQQPMEEQISFSNLILSGKSLQNKHIIIDIIPEPGQMSAYGDPDILYREFGRKYEGPATYAEGLGTLAPGKNTVKVVVKCNYEEIAAGTFSIDGTDFSLFVQRAAELNAAAAGAGARKATFPEARMTDAATEARMIAAVKNSNDWKTGFIDGTDVLKIAIIDNDWITRRHEITGIILHRYIRAAIAVKTQAGGCAYHTVTFQEDYADNRFQPLRYDGASVKTDIICENLK
jgi:hypothetical protein